MKKLRNTKGITLIALVITIIVLLILAGVTITSLTGENGLLSRSSQVNKKTLEGKALDEISLAWNEVQIDGLKEGWDNKIKAASLATALKNGSTASTSGDNIIVKYNGYTATINTVDGTIEMQETETNPTISFSLGQEVIVNGERFFVIEENDTTSKDTITLLTKYNLKIDADEQATSDMTNDQTKIAFCTDPDRTYKGYWKDISGITYPCDLNEIESTRATAYNKAVSYGTAIGGTGRLLTKSEYDNLAASSKIPNIMHGKDYSTGPIATDNYLCYWIGTAYADYSAYFVSGLGNGNIIGGNNCVYVNAGTRPVITISKSLVSPVQ